MQDLKKSKLKQKFYGFSAVLIVSLVFTAIYSLTLMGIINTGTSEISNKWLPSVIIAEELNTATSNFRIAEISHVVSTNPVALEAYEDVLVLISQDIDNLFAKYQNNYVTDDIDQALITQAKSLWSGYLLVHRRMIEASKNGDPESAMKIMENESEVLFSDVASVFSRLVTFNTAGAEKADVRSDYLYSSTYIIVVLITLLAIVISIQFKNLMSEIEDTQTILAHANEEAMLSSKAKSNFLANMSHEIRTPMNAISGMIDIILRETNDKTVVEYAQNVKRACDSLLFIINDVLDISKIESGKLDIVEAEYYLPDVLNDVLTIANSRLEHKELLFITKFQNDLPQLIIGDEVRVKQVMVNILNNAIKFTESGHIAFNVEGSYLNGELNLELSITDTGVGISQDNIEKLFEEFERVDTKKNRNIEGTGLGLAISKRLAQMMGGEIVVTSELGKGTVFTVKIMQKYKSYTPLAEVKNSKSVLIFESRELYLRSIEEACHQLSLKKIISCALQSELNEALLEHKFDFIFTTALYQNKVEEMLTANNLTSQIVILADNNEVKTKFDYPSISLPANSLSIANVLNGKASHSNSGEEYGNFIAPDCKVLVVDDNHVNLIVAKGLMKPYQFNIETAQNGQEAVDKIKANKYDLVFMDHMMPVLDGIDATIMIRSLQGEYFRSLPIVALTANAIVGTREMFLKEGMNDFLDKPIKVEKLNDILAKWLPKQSQIPVTQEELVNDEFEKDKDEDEPPLKINSVDTKLGIKRVGGNFDDYVNILNHYQKDGVKRVDIIREFYENKDYNSYKIEVHAIKSASASIGATALSQKAGRLEDACTASDWVYVNQNNNVFLEEFKLLLDDIESKIKDFVEKEEIANKIVGVKSILLELMENLKDALDMVDINECDDLLEKIYSYQWDDELTEVIDKVRDFVNDYEYDEATETIEEFLKTE